MINFTGVDIQFNSIVSFLKKELTFHSVCRQLVCKQIIQTKATQLSIEVIEDEIQAEADYLRRDLRLESAQKTLEWLQEKMITADEWEESIHDRLLMQKLAKVMFWEAATHHFYQRKLDYESVSLYKIITSNKKLAQELTYQIEEKETSFFEAAHHYDSNTERRRCCGYEGEISRWALAPDVAACVFAAPAKTVIGPMVLDQEYGLFFVDEFIKPELTEDLHRTICDRLFYEWLEAELQRNAS